MSVAIKKSLVSSVAETAIQSAWIQWHSLGSFITAPRAARSVVDPEALVLASLALRDHERRLWDVLASWAVTGSRLLSVQRIKNLNDEYPERTAGRLAEFALIALMEGGDHRWRKLAATEPGPRPRRQDLRVPSAGGWDPAALVVRLRLGIGVGLQADVLAFLLSQQGAWTSARVIAEAIGYSAYSIRRTADKMAEARFIESTMEKPVEYRADRNAWSPVLGLRKGVLPWRYWHQAYAFVAELVTLGEEGEIAAPTRYLLSSRLRDLTKKHRNALRLIKIPSPDPHQFAGEEFVSAFEQLAATFTGWMSEEV
jgi:hypothetical protein